MKVVQGQVVLTNCEAAVVKIEQGWIKFEWRIIHDLESIELGRILADINLAFDIEIFSNIVNLIGVLIILGHSFPNLVKLDLNHVLEDMLRGREIYMPSEMGCCPNHRIDVVDTVPGSIWQA